MWIGTQVGRFPGLFIALIAFQFGYGTQAAWLWFRSRGYLAEIAARETAVGGMVQEPVSAD